jgi:hypothetical protein
MAKPVSRFQALLAELKRRNVFKVASVYAVTAWAASMGAAELLPAFGAPDWSHSCFRWGLPIAVVLAWAYEMRGVVRMQCPRRSGPVRRFRENIPYCSAPRVQVTGRRLAAANKIFTGLPHRSRRIAKSTRRPDDQPLYASAQSEGLW